MKRKSILLQPPQCCEKIPKDWEGRGEKVYCYLSFLFLLILSPGLSQRQALLISWSLHRVLSRNLKSRPPGIYLDSIVICIWLHMCKAQICSAIGLRWILSCCNRHAKCFSLPLMQCDLDSGESGEIYEFLLRYIGTQFLPTPQNRPVTQSPLWGLESTKNEVITSRNSGSALSRGCFGR